MSAFAETGQVAEKNILLRDAFFRWQCKVRQILMRQRMGQPDDAITPTVFLPTAPNPLGQIITVICKKSNFSKTPELKHIFNATIDPAIRRDRALQLFSETYYQKYSEFSEMLMATFLPNAFSAKALISSGLCRLEFESYGQNFKLACKVTHLGPSDANYVATWWHNILFNPNLSPDTIILGFTPIWESSSSLPELNKTA